ncbi:hypothetical protein FACS189443_1910 [Planctomycetales bacterium]|nr:hypothetical protein FACS189443_1910 [Planctomycetales bacterium]
MHAQLDCDKQDVERFLTQDAELIAESRRQLHVGLPLDTLVEIEQRRKPISSGTSGFVVRKSGLLVPTQREHLYFYVFLR